jgi:hypothetical protein
MTDDARTIDLDALKAAREEATAAIPRIVFGGETFELPVEVPATFAFRAQEGDMEAAINELLDEDAPRFWALRPTVSDLMSLTGALATAYGLDSPGE